jgi:hypothetical protein
MKQPDGHGRQRHRRLHRVAIAIATGVLAYALLLGACGGGDDAGDAAVRPIAEILDGEIRIEDIGASAATVRVTTSVPVVCSVVFGTDTAYGRLSTDPDMGGAAHTDHEAPMRGLEPDTVYHYRLQGTGPDGTLYASDDRTFRTAVEEVGGQAPGVNLASIAQGARVIEFSSAYGDSATWQASNAIDGDASTEWSSQGDGDNAYITVELATEAWVTAVGLWTRTMGNSAQVEQFQVVTDRGETLGPFNLPDADGPYTFEVSTVARTLRFEVVASSGGNTGAVEIAVYGDAVP